MSSVFSENKKISYIVRKNCLAILLIFVCFCTSVFQGCKAISPGSQDQEFKKFTKEIFCEQTAANSISLHYTLKDPEKYGIRPASATFGGFETEKGDALAFLENMKYALKKFDPDKLSVQNQVTYDILKYYCQMAEADAEYILYDEPLDLVSGIQTQLPVLLSEYRFYSRKDVDVYLELLKTVPEYFRSLAAFEQQKAKAGLFMADDMAEQVIRQCDAFAGMKEENYLFSTFADKVTQLEELDVKEKSNYIQKNALMVTCYVVPAYQQLSAQLQKLKGSGKTEEGLYYLSRGKEYYEHEVQLSTGSDRSVPEMKELTKKQILEDLEAMESILERLAAQGGAEKNTGQENPAAEKDPTESSQQKKDDIKEENNNGENEDEDAENAGESEENIAQRAAKIFASAGPSQQAASIGSANPVTILNDLEKRIKKAFPEPPKIKIEVKYVPEEMEEHLSPAFYMIPAIDAYEENVIYVNEAHMGNPLTLFTTLAHEGYPGHLYQTIYYAATDPDPLRSIFNFGGYVEGWATYAEMCSYYLTPLEKEQATLLQKNASVMLGLYTLADIGIHYEGWSRMDTVSFFADYGIKDTTAVEQIYDLIIGSPGNYLKYYIGYVEFLELKKEWAAQRGADFSQKEFHEAVLSVGPAPFEIVKKYMGQIK